MKRKGETKSYRAVLEDIRDLDDNLNEKEVIQDFGRKMVVRTKDFGPEIFVRAIYKLTKNIQLELLVEGKDNYEEVPINLSEFYEFYNLLLLYSMTNHNLKSSIARLSMLKAEGEMNQTSQPRNSFWREDKICAVCCDKPVQNLLPCFHGFCEDCCEAWYEKKGKHECPMCRDSIGDDKWAHKAFEIMNKDTIEENNLGKTERKNIVEFVNKRTKNVKLL